MKPLIDFKLKHISSAYDDTKKVYLLYDLKIAEELIDYAHTMFDKQVRYRLYLSDEFMDCWILDDYGNEALCFSIEHEVELDREEVETIQTILNLFKSDMYRCIIENKSMHEWLASEDIHVTI